MGDDVLLNKCESIEKCLKSIEKYYRSDASSLQDQMTQDAIVLNLERACQLSIDIAMYMIKELKLGIPKESREAFEKISEQNIIPKELSTSLKKMVSFRNIAVHEYKKLDLVIVQKILENELETTFKNYVKCILKQLPLVSSPS